MSVWKAVLVAVSAQTVLANSGAAKVLRNGLVMNQRRAKSYGIPFVNTPYAPDPNEMTLEQKAELVEMNTKWIEQLSKYFPASEREPLSPIEREKRLALLSRMLVRGFSTTAGQAELMKQLEEMAEQLNVEQPLPKSGVPFADAPEVRHETEVIGKNQDFQATLYNYDSPDVKTVEVPEKAEVEPQVFTPFKDAIDDVLKNEEFLKKIGKFLDQIDLEKEKSD